MSDSAARLSSRPGSGAEPRALGALARLELLRVALNWRSWLKTAVWPALLCEIAARSKYLAGSGVASRAELAHYLADALEDADPRALRSALVSVLRELEQDGEVRDAE